MASCGRKVAPESHLRQKARSTGCRFASEINVASGGASRAVCQAAGLAYANWLFDCSSLCASLESVHAHVPLRGVLVVYALSQLVANLPLLPGGGGTVEIALVAGFLAFQHTGSANVLAGVLLYRVISCWGLIPIGWLAVLSSRGTHRTASLTEAPSRT